MKTKLVQPTPQMIEARNAVLKTLREKEEALGLTPPEILGIMAYTVGQIIAVQDQTKMTPAMAIGLVQANIEAGNQDAINSLRDAPTGAKQ